jgi:hypothetical protein
LLKFLRDVATCDGQLLQNDVLFIFFRNAHDNENHGHVGLQSRARVNWEQKTDVVLKVVMYESRLFSGRRRDVALGSYLNIYTVFRTGCEVPSTFIGRSQWPRGLRRGCVASLLLELWVRIPLTAWMSVSCECCVLSGRGLCDGLIPRPEESYRVCVCVIECGQA